MTRLLAALGVALLACGVSAEAYAAIPIRVPRWHPPTPLTVEVTPRAPTDLALTRAGDGYVAPEVQHQLDDLRDDVVASLDGGIKRIARTRQAREALWNCASDGLESTADAVGEAMAGGDPDTTATYVSAAGGCVKAQIPDLSSPSDVDATSHYLLNLSAGYVNEMSRATTEQATLDRYTAPVQRALAHQRWLQQTARAAGQRAGTAATFDNAGGYSTAGTSSDGSPVPPWLVGGALVLVLAALVARRRLR
jgi:hypothetical protein